MQGSQMTDLQRRAPVLSFADTVLPLVNAEAEAITLHLDFQPGELVILHPEDETHEETLLQAACGLLSPRSGSVRFQGRNWLGLSPDRANASRARIGILFRDDNWIPYQTIMESVILPQLHHTRRPLDAVCREATRWASRFGLPGLPRDIPAAVSDEDRRCANFVRAFIGEPSLIVVQHQTAGLSKTLLEATINALRDARDRGAAVLWFSRDLDFGQDGTIPASRRLRLDGSVLSPLEVVA